MNIVLIHDYLSSFGGAESVLLALHEIWPKAPIYTIFSNVRQGKDKLLDEKFKNAKIIKSWFGKLPFCEKLISPLRFLIPLIWRSFDFSDYDLVISSASWAITKGFSTQKIKEICYCHTPPRYLYGYETSRDWQKNKLVRLYALVVNHFMRMYDFRQAQKVTWFVANSKEVQSRIKKFYRRDSVVINPPVEIPIGLLKLIKPTDFFLTGGRLEAPKNFDLVIKACNRLKLPLKIYGTGSQEQYLRSIAGPTIEFLGFVGDEKKQELLSQTKAFIAAARDEDFGITPVEAMAAGRPVIAFRGGGYLESVVGGKTGEFFPTSPPADGGAGLRGTSSPTVENLIKILRQFKSEKYKPADCRQQAKKFSKERFKREIKKFVKKQWRT